MTSLAHNEEEFRHAALLLFEDDDVMRMALRSHPWMLKYASKAVRADRDVVVSVVCVCGLFLEYASAALRDDAEVVSIALNKSAGAFRFASERMRARADFAYRAIQHGYSGMLEFVAPALRNNRKFVCLAVAQRGMALKHVPEAFQADGALVRVALRNHGCAIRYAAEELRSDRSFVLDAVRSTGTALQYVPSHFRKDREVVLAAVAHCGCALQYAAPELRADREVVLAAVTEDDGQAFRYASLEMRMDLNFVREIVEKSPTALACAAWRPSYGIDRDIALRAVTKDASVMTFSCCERWRADKELVLLMVDRAPLLLRLASQSLRADREVVLHAVRGDGSALGYATPELFGDPLLLSWARLSPGARLWRRCRERVKGERAAWLWLEAVAQSKEEHRIKRAKLGHVWEEEEGEGGDPLAAAVA